MEGLKAADMGTVGCPGFTSVQQGRDADSLVHGNFGSDGQIIVGEDAFPFASIYLSIYLSSNCKLNCFNNCATCHGCYHGSIVKAFTAPTVFLTIT